MKLLSVASVLVPLIIKFQTRTTPVDPSDPPAHSPHKAETRSVRSGL